MSDDELNAEVARLQSQPDGLMAAMALIEAQNLLRQQDSFAYSQWQLQAQMHAASAPIEAQEPEPVIAEPATTSIPVVPNPAAAAPSPVIASEPIAAVGDMKSVEDVVAALNRNYENPVVTEPVASEASQTDEILEDLQVQQAEPAPISSVASVAKETSTSEEPTSSDPETTIMPIARTRTSGALSWSWISISASPLVLVLAAFLKESGASLAQSLVVVSGLILATSVFAGVGAVAAKRGSSQIGVVSRAAFGVWGNVFPAILMLLVKIIWTVALLIFGVRILSPLISNQPWFAVLSMQFVFPAEFTALLLTVIPVVVIASLVAGFGGITLLRAQQLAAIFSLVGIAGVGYFVFTTYSILDAQQGEMLRAAGLLDLAILSFALFGFTVFSQSGDFARKLPVETPGAKVFFLSFVSTLFIPLIVGVMGVLWVFMAEEGFGLLLTSQLLPAIASAAPLWVFIAFVVAVGLSVLQLLASSIYSLAGGLASIGGRIPGAVAVLLLSVLVLAVTLVSSMLLGTSSLLSMLIELILLASVVGASYSGIVLSDALIRSRDYHEVSLTRDYGFYGRFNVANTIGFILATALGFGYLNGAGVLSFWAGYLGDFTPAIFEIAGSNIGIAMAFGLAVLFPVLFGIPRIKGQERKLLELDERREELKEYLDSAN
jgi:purine-cytosine permease-like protein